MVIKKFNYVRFIAFIAVVFGIILGIVIGIKTIIKNIKYKESYDYKLSLIGYNEEEILQIKSNLDNNLIDKLLTHKYNENIVGFVKEKYFIYNNLDKYIEYKNSNKKKYDDTKIVAIINTEANIDWFDEEKETDITKGDLMLVNRLYGLSKDYEPDDIVDIPVKYAYSGNKIKESILDNIIALANDAQEAGYTFVVDGSYRSYSDQEIFYNRYSNNFGKSEADKYVARPGHSEYETGLSFDFKPYIMDFDTPKLSDKYIWLRNNAYKYGFIFRFDADKEYLTGFEEYTWRLRYVGKEVAKIINDEKICFEEYYAYYVRGNE